MIASSMIHEAPELRVWAADMDKVHKRREEKEPKKRPEQIENINFCKPHEIDKFKSTGVQTKLKYPAESTLQITK